MRSKKIYLKFKCKEDLPGYFEKDKEYYGYENHAGFHIFYKKGHLYFFGKPRLENYFLSVEEMKNIKRTEMIDKMLNDKNDKNDILELIYTRKNNTYALYY